MKNQILTHAIYFFLLVIVNVIVSIVCRLLNIGWKPFPPWVILIIFPFVFSVSACVFNALFKRRSFLILALTWAIVGAILMIINDQRGTEFVYLTNRYIAYLTMAIDYTNKNVFKVTGLIIDLFVQCVFLFFYIFYMGKLSLALTTRVVSWMR
jgi:hypothetical protein